jgi:hypothetical protein
MKTKNFLFSATLLLGGLLNAQEDQTVKATKMGDGNFLYYVITQNGNSFTYGGIDRLKWTLSSKPYAENFKEIVIKTEESTSKGDSYYPDEEAFPATYVKGRLNTEAVMRGWDYMEMEEEQRIVVLDEWVYLLSNWKNKDDYKIEKAFKKGELSGLKLIKAQMGAAKEMEKANHKETLQKYLDEAFKKQSELLPAWKAKNKAKIDKRIAAKVRYRFTIDSVNGAYWNTDEGKRVKARLNKKAGQAKVTLVNDLGIDVLLCHGQGVSTRLKPGEKKQFECEEGTTVKQGKPRQNNTSQFDATNVVILKLDGQNCGRVVNASTVYK